MARFNKHKHTYTHTRKMARRHTHTHTHAHTHTPTHTHRERMTHAYTTHHQNLQWFFSPMQVPMATQWWSKVATQCPHVRQCRDRRGTFLGRQEGVMGQDGKTYERNMKGKLVFRRKEEASVPSTLTQVDIYLQHVIRFDT